MCLRSLCALRPDAQIMLVMTYMETRLSLLTGGLMRNLEFCQPTQLRLPKSWYSCNDQKKQIFAIDMLKLAQVLHLDFIRKYFL